MLTFLHPAALLALLGLLVPVAIHLWNRRPGREVAVGSLRWLASGANRRLRQLRPEQLGLLALRAALLTLLAGALAGPAWQRLAPTTSRGGQILLSPEVAGTPALAALRPTIDSLRRRGYGLRWLAAGFPKMAGGREFRADSLGAGDSARRLVAAERAPGFRWARVRQAAGSFAGQPLYVVAPAALRGFQGAHPPLGAGVSWQLLPTRGAASWLQGAALGGDSLRLLLGRSTEAQTSFRQISVARPRPGVLVRVAGLPALRLATGVSGSQLQPQGEAPGAAATDLPAPVPVRTRPLQILVYATADYAPDARCLLAGLRAAAVGLPVPLALRQTTAPPSPAADAPDWLFWLTDAPLPPAWRAAGRHGTRVWQEANGPGVADPAQLVIAADRLPVLISRRGAARPPASAATSAGGAPAGPLWFDSRGRAVLSRQGVGKGAFYYLATRLNPAWSELADSPALPAGLLALLQPEPTDEAAPPATAAGQSLAAPDQRALDPAQLAPGPNPVITPENPAVGPSKAVLSAAPAAFQLTDLGPWLVLAAGVLFALERLLAGRRASRNQSATSIL